MFLDEIMDFAAEHAGWLVAGSLSSLVVGLVLAPLLILRLPADYFTYRRRHTVASVRPHLLVHLLLTGLKNTVGAILIAAGLVLFVLPGQGLITLLAGLIVMNYPGKFRLERWLVQRPHVLAALNWLRRRHGRAPLLDPDDTSTPDDDDAGAAGSSGGTARSGGRGLMRILTE